MKGVITVKEIKGITCDAKNCIYHSKNNNCNAGNIKVGCKTATDESETKCETFICESGCEMK